METEPILPPAFSLIQIGADDDPLARACTDAAGQVEDGALYLAARPDQMRLAVIVEPEASLSRSLPVLVVAMGAMGDALGSVIPPAIPVNYGWPGTLYIDGTWAGSMRAAADLARVDAPGWIALSFEIEILGPANRAPGTGLNRTNLAEHGAGHVTPPELACAFGRYFLGWVRRWQDHGFDPVRENWNARARAAGDKIDKSARPKDGPRLRQFIEGGS